MKCKFHYINRNLARSVRLHPLPLPNLSEFGDDSPSGPYRCPPVFISP